MYIYHTYKSKRWLVDINTVTIPGRREYYSGFLQAVCQLTFTYNPASDHVMRVKPYANPKG